MPAQPDGHGRNRELIALDTELRGPQHPFVAGGRNQLGCALMGQGCPDEALAELADALAVRRGTPQEGKPLWFETQALLGSALLDLGRYGEAEAPLLEAWRGFWARNDERRLERFGVAGKLATLYERIGWTSEAELYRAYVDTR